MPKDTTALKEIALLLTIKWLNIHAQCIILYNLTYHSKFQLPIQDILYTHKIQNDQKAVPQILQLQPETPSC